MGLAERTSSTHPAPLAAVCRRWLADGARVPSLALWLGALFGIGLTLRLVWVFYTDTIPLGGDPAWYLNVAANLAQGEGFAANHNEVGQLPRPPEVTAFWPPGYPFALAAVFKLSGVSVTSAQVLNAVLGALTVPFIYGLGSAIFDRRVGLLAAGLFAVFPNVIAGTPLLFSEPLFTLIFVAALWLLVVEPADRKWLPLVAFGALTGLAMLTRGQGAVLVPIAAVFWLARDGWRAALRSSAVALLVAFAVIAPWTVRNAIELHAFVPISTSSGTALRSGHAPESVGTTKWTHDEIDGFYMWESLYRPDWEVKGYREYMRLAVDYALTHPKRETELGGLKIYHLYRSDAEVIPWLTTLGATPLEPDGLEDALWHVFDSSYYLLFFAAIASAPFWLRRDANRLLLASVFVFWTLFHVLFLGEPRYHIPLYPFFAIAVVGGLSIAIARGLAALERLRQRGPAAPVLERAP